MMPFVQMELKILIRTLRIWLEIFLRTTTDISSRPEAGKVKEVNDNKNVLKVKRAVII